MPTSILFYVNGHGYGHAVRTAEVVRRVIGRLAGRNVDIHIRTSAPAVLFQGFSHLVSPLETSLPFADAGVVEENPLRIDVSKTLARAAANVEQLPRIVHAEARFAREAGASLIVADIPFAAGDIAEAAGIPCLAIGNFTWDWIYQAYLPEYPQYERAVAQIQSGYSKMAAWIRLPLSHDSNVFREVIDVPLVCRWSSRDRGGILEALKLDPADSRPIVLAGMRGRASSKSVASIARRCRDFRFIQPEPASLEAADNLWSISPESRLTFLDVLSVCDVIVGKYGYGTLADCIASGVALLWVKRSNFREDEILSAAAPGLIRTLEIPADDYYAGDWKMYLDRLTNAPKPECPLRTDGAEVCAGIIEERFRQLPIKPASAPPPK